MKQLTTKQIDQFLRELNSRDKRKRALAASKLGNASNSYDVIIPALQQMVAHERDDFAKGLATSSLQVLTTLQKLQDGTSEEKDAALDEIDGEQLKNKRIISVIEQIAATDDDNLKQKAQAILIKQQNSRSQQQARLETNLPPNLSDTNTFNDSSKTNELMVVTVVPIVTIIFVVLGLIGATILGFENLFICGSISAVIGLIVALIQLYSAYEKRCPSCGIWDSEEEQVDRRKKIDSKTGYKTVTRTDEIRNSRGDKIGETTRQEQIRVLKSTYVHYYKCRNCGHEWSGMSTSETESFTE